jgi:hypothetical protein
MERSTIAPLHWAPFKRGGESLKLFFEKLIWPVLVVALIELIFAQSQPHWFLVTLAFAIINVGALVGFRLIFLRPISRSSS